MKDYQYYFSPITEGKKSLCQNLEPGADDDVITTPDFYYNQSNHKSVPTSIKKITSSL